MVFMDPFVGRSLGRKLSRRELTRALRLSLSAEQEATHVYEALADAAPDKISAAVFQDIANEERVHVGEFQTLLDRLAPGERKLLEKGACEVEMTTCRQLRDPRAVVRCILRTRRRKECKR